jgi:hypothetical protein
MIEMRKTARTVVYAVVCIVSLAFVWFTINPYRPTPTLQITGVNYSLLSEEPPRVFVNGTVVNSSSMMADHVTVMISVYVEGVSPHGWRLVKTEFIDLGRISANSTRDFEKYIDYEGIEGFVFAGIRYGIL